MQHDSEKGAVEYKIGKKQIIHLILYTLGQPPMLRRGFRVLDFENVGGFYRCVFIKWAVDKFNIAAELFL